MLFDVFSWWATVPPALAKAAPKSPAAAAPKAPASKTPASPAGGKTPAVTPLKFREKYEHQRYVCVAVASALSMVSGTDR
jgi:hypothetical protein